MTQRAAPILPPNSVLAKGLSKGSVEEKREAENGVFNGHVFLNRACRASAFVSLRIEEISAVWACQQNWPRLDSQRCRRKFGGLS